MGTYLLSESVRCWIGLRRPCGYLDWTAKSSTAHSPLVPVPVCLYVQFKMAARWPLVLAIQPSTWDFEDW